MIKNIFRKKSLYVVGVMVAIALSLIFSNFNHSPKLESVKLKNNFDKSNMFVIMVENPDTESEEKYVKWDHDSFSEDEWNINWDSEVFPPKDDGFVFNNQLSGCVDEYGNSIEDEFDENGNVVRKVLSYNNNNQLQLMTNDASYCYLYFDRWKNCLELVSEGQQMALSDCLLLQDAKDIDSSNTTVDGAKEIIQNKTIKTETNKAGLDLEVTAPESDYKSVCKQITTPTDSPLVSNFDQIFSESVTFDQNTGFYELGKDAAPGLLDQTTGNATLSENITEKIESTCDSYSENMKYYYVCENGATTKCTKVYRILSYTPDANKREYHIYKVQELYYTNDKSFNSQTGLYSVEDDYTNVNDKTNYSYIYRGEVKNNYVDFAGKLWQIVRINGNGSIRMIYSGNRNNYTGEDAQIGKSQFNSSNWDPAYLGYQHPNDDYQEDGVYFENSELIVDEIDYQKINISNVDNYLYCKSYLSYVNPDTNKLYYKLDATEGNCITGKWPNVHSEVIKEDGYKYTCLKINANYNCNIVYVIKDYVSNNEAKVSYVSYHTTSYDSAITNAVNSDIKDVIDNWYLNNIEYNNGTQEYKTDIEGRKYSDYLSDEVFCNDRSFYIGNGYSIIPTTYYNGGKRITQKKASLKCQSYDNDKFSVSDSIGNGNLEYPIGLITADELMFAGAVGPSVVNNQFYLYTGANYWTMTPYNFSAPNARASMYILDKDGRITSGVVNGNQGVRPVINIKPGQIMTGGVGTVENPYTIEPITPQE